MVGPLTVLIGLNVLWSSSLLTQFDSSAKAKAIFDRGELALRSDHIDEAIADFQKALKIDPNFVQAQEEYISTYIRKPYLIRTGGRDEQFTDEEQARVQSEVEKRRRSLVLEYHALAKAHPRSPAYQWALGKLYEENDSSKPESYCHRAVEIDDHFTPGYECLSTIAYRIGALDEAIKYQRRVVELKPRDPDARFAYGLYLSGDPAAYKASVEEMIAKFPNAAASAQALYWYAVEQTTEVVQIHQFERLRALFSPARFGWSATGMTELFALYDRTEPIKARSLAVEMHALLPNDDDWSACAAYSNDMYSAEQVIKNKPLEALATVASIRAPSPRFDMGRAQVLQARALDLLGRTAEAYSFLVTSYAKHPTDAVRAVIHIYAERLNKSLQDEESNIWSSVSAASSQAIPFSLRSFTDGTLVSLSSYRGHVVIVEFWFPRCGPCRQAFPHLQQALSKFRARGLVVLVINEEERQDAEVIPLLKSKGYDFIPLKATQKWASTQYGVSSAPVTFLVGRDGRVYFHPRFYDRFEEHTSELEIEELLEHTE